MVASLSDVAAMGCSPTLAVVTLGIRSDHEVDDLLDLYRGMLDACDRFGGVIIGGDVVRSPALFVTVAMHGAAQTGSDARPRLLTRDSASPGAEIAVTGSLGCSAGGLRMMSEGLAFGSETAGHLAGAHNRPVARVPEGLALARSGVATAMDISDGLVDDLGKLCAASGVAGKISSDRVPIDDILRSAFPDDCVRLALAGGEDYELLFTAPAGVVGRAGESFDVPVSVIGEIVEGPPGVTVLDERGDPLLLEEGGWDHFRGAGVDG
jgi:thiamine-monophosphate kinase